MLDMVRYTCNKDKDNERVTKVSNMKTNYTVVAFQHGKETFRLDVLRMVTANSVVKSLCGFAMKENENLSFSIYDKNACEIVNGNYWKGDNYYRYYDLRCGFLDVKCSLA